LVDPLIGCLLNDWQIPNSERRTRWKDVKKTVKLLRMWKEDVVAYFKMLPPLWLFGYWGPPQTTPERLVCKWSELNRVPQSYHYVKLLEVTYILPLTMQLITGWYYVATKLRYCSGQCHVSGGWPLAPSSHHGGRGLIQGHSNILVALGQVSFQVPRFSPSVNHSTSTPYSFKSRGRDGQNYKLTQTALCVYRPTLQARTFLGQPPACWSNCSKKKKIKKHMEGQSLMGP
jgi:hypothetical protein